MLNGATRCSSAPARPASYINDLNEPSRPSRSSQPRFVLDFRSSEGQEGVQRWYKRQGFNTRFTQLEYRKYREGRTRHDLVTVWVSQSTLCRFDRKPQFGESRGASAEDSAHVLSSFDIEYKRLLEQTEVLFTIKIPYGEDIGVILAVCQGMQMHSMESESSYDQIRYSCCFFSWTLVAAVARRTYNWETLVTQEGWDNILRDSLSNSNQHSGEEVGRRPWLSGTLSKLRSYIRPRSKVNPQSPATSTAVEEFQDILRSKYSESYGAIEGTLSKLLLYSQLGPELKQEMHRIESSGFLWAKCTLTENMVLRKSYRAARWSRANPPPHSCYMYELERLKRASCATAEMLLTKNHPESTTANGTWEDTWRDSWNIPDTMQTTMEHVNPVKMPMMLIPMSVISLTVGTHPRPAIYTSAKKGVADWDDLTSKIMEDWKGAWDGCSKLTTQYTETLTTTVMTRVLEPLNDSSPEQLIPGDKFKDLKGPGLPESLTSLQGFIRYCVRDCFERIDKLDFGSFEECITKTEEDMCKIWVTSLGIIKLNRYQPEYAGNGGAEV